MKTPFGAALLAASVLAAPAFAQTMPPAPPPTATAPAVIPGAPVPPLTSRDTRFVQTALEGNMAEIQAAQLALQHSQDQAVRDFAQKMITDHTAAQQTLMPIAQRHGIPAPAAPTPRDQAMMARLSRLNGLAFDRAYVNAMVREHGMMVKDMNDQLSNGQDQQINAWVQNTRPTVLQHYQIAEQLQAELPRTTG
jgi:putative membrane protein